MSKSLSRRTVLRAAAAGTAAGALALTASGCSRSDRLVVYTNAASDGRGDWMTAESRAAGFNIVAVDLGGADLKNRLLAERFRPLADVVFGLNDAYFYQLRDEDILQHYTPSWADDVSTSYGDQESFWGMYRFPILLAYNTAKWNIGSAPTDWPDLWQDNRFWNQYETPRKKYSMTAQTVITGILARHRQDSGLAGVAPSGWAAIDAYFKHGNRAVQGVDLYARMASGDVSLGPMWMHGRLPRERQFHVQTRGVAPPIGVPMVVESVAMVNRTPRADQAAMFIDWWGSPETTAAFSREFYYVPLNKKAMPAANAEAIKEADSYIVQQIDWRFVADHLDEWIERVTLEYQR